MKPWKSTSGDTTSYGLDVVVTDILFLDPKQASAPEEVTQASPASEAETPGSDTPFQVPTSFREIGRPMVGRVDAPCHAEEVSRESSRIEGGLQHTGDLGFSRDVIDPALLFAQALGDLAGDFIAQRTCLFFLGIKPITPTYLQRLAQVDTLANDHITNEKECA